MADLKARMLSWKAPSEIVRGWFPKEGATSEKLCTACGHIGHPTEIMSGRREIELVLWSAFAVIACLFLLTTIIDEFVKTQSLFSRLLHGTHRLLTRSGELFALLSIGYTLYRFSAQHPICPKCNSAAVIPPDSPRAKELMKGR